MHLLWILTRVPTIAAKSLNNHVDSTASLSSFINLRLAQWVYEWLQGSDRGCISQPLWKLMYFLSLRPLWLSTTGQCPLCQEYWPSLSPWFVTPSWGNQLVTQYQANYTGTPPPPIVKGTVLCPHWSWYWFWIWIGLYSVLHSWHHHMCFYKCFVHCYYSIKYQINTWYEEDALDSSSINQNGPTKWWKRPLHA